MQVLGRFPLSVSFPPSHAGTKSKIFEESLLVFFNGSFQRHHFAVPIAVQQRRPEAKVARWQNLIPSFPWIAPEGRVWGCNPRKGMDQILQGSVAEP